MGENDDLAFLSEAMDLIHSHISATSATLNNVLFATGSTDALFGQTLQALSSLSAFDRDCKAISDSIKKLLPEPESRPVQTLGRTHEYMMLNVGDEALIALTGDGDLEIGGTVVRVIRFFPNPHEPTILAERAEVEVVKPSPHSECPLKVGQRLDYPVSGLRSAAFEAAYSDLGSAD